MKIAIGEFHQETNSFNPFVSTRKDYEVFGIQKGSEVISCVDDSCALQGMINTLKAEAVQILPTCRMWANAWGRVEDKVVEEFLEEVASVLKDHLPLDGVCLSLHGATQSVLSDDVCGDILESVRKIVGAGTTITASLDLHAHVTKKMIDHADFLCGYQTYPHIDFYETGERAAKLCLEGIKQGRPLYKQFVRIPMVVPASGFTTMEGSFARLMNWAKTLEEQGELVDFSIFQMQPWLDVENGNSAVLTVSTTLEDPYALKFAEKLVEIRHKMMPKLSNVVEIIESAEKQRDGEPIVLVDSSDSTNAGACGDSAYVLQAIQECRSPVKAAIALCCKPAVDKAFAVGIGNRGAFSIGAALDKVHTQPVEVTAYVQSLHDGVFIQEGPAKRGLENNLGKTAVLKVGNTHVVVTSEFLLGPGDLQLYRHFGIEPTFYQLVVVKACSSFKAGYQHISNKVMYADTPGAATANLQSLDYKKIPETYYPFTEISKEDIEVVRL